MSTLPPTEILIIGAGVLGLSTATLLQQTYPSSPISIISSDFPTSPPLSPSLNTATSSNTDEVPRPPPPSYASMWAGAHYRPIPFIPPDHPTFSSLPPETQLFHRQLAREAGWAQTTATKMLRIAREIPSAGVDMVVGEEYLEDPPVQNLLLKPGDVYAFPGDGFRVWDSKEIEMFNKNLDVERSRRTATNGESNEVKEDGQQRIDKSAGEGQVKWAATYTTYIVNPHIYTAHLLSQFLSHGGQTVKAKLSDLRSALKYTRNPLPSSSSHAQSPPTNTVIVNCSGIGITPDKAVTPIRGQTVLVSRPYHRTVTRQCADGTWSFLIPRPLGGGTIIGGTKQVGDIHGLPRMEERDVLLANAKRYFRDFVGEGREITEEEVVCDNVGFRPGRKGGVRVEKEVLGRAGTGRGEGLNVHGMDGERFDGNVHVVHGYGAGGRGYEISWGVAAEVCGLVAECLRESHQDGDVGVSMARL